MIIAVHVPKTAGTSFGRALERCFGRRLLRDYTEDRPEGPPVYTWPRRWRSRAWVRSHVNELAASYDAIHGQFTASKYFPFLRGGRGLCIFVREPTDRTISSYRDALSPTARYRDDVGSAVRSRYARYTAKLLTLSQYASLPKQSRIYELYTSGLPIEQFAFVGITEEYEASLTLFKAIFGIDLPKYRANVNKEVPDDFSVREREAVRTTQRANYVIYDEARRRFDALYSRHVR